MRQCTVWISLGIAAACSLLAGCAKNSGQLTACQQEKEQLLATIRSQRETNRALDGQVASLESRLDQAEKELARGGSGTRLSSRPATPPAAVPPGVKTPPSESLPWRAPAGKSDSKSAPADSRRSSSAGSSASLLALARRDARVRYDATTRAAQVELPIAFDQQTATLTGEGKQQLDALAKLLKTDDARALRIMVAGSAVEEPAIGDRQGDSTGQFTSARQLGAARAQAVADYLDRHGIAQERLAVTASGGRSGASTGASGGVQVYLLDPDTPLIGWSPGQPVRR